MRFIHNRSLLRHMREQHRAESWLQCTLCDQYFRRRPTYQLHLLSCTGAVEDSDKEEVIMVSSGEDSVVDVSSEDEREGPVMRQ